ncbi:MAG TPA: branched-chain amino acid aminotransferase [Syntrophales bacterium]|nr:branched-chain amino acid aminotransferase [Syntrophales bacterium]HOL58713.1 branched-chain amino acid aminotransferase [Syntrophales bacterium]HPO34999.1 branched-chain amino acid aminotransferase [Syntrophales bacterium]
MEIACELISPEKRKPKYTDEGKLGFGQIFTDHMFTLQYHRDRGWYEPKIGPYRPFVLDPATICLHYAQMIFEGLKAYHGPGGEIYLFRPGENAKRMNRSAERMCMPPLDEELFLKAVKALVWVDRAWLPKGKGTSLYIRPTMIATEKALGVHVSSEYLFFIILSAVGAYYAEGFNPTKIYVIEEYTRTAPGGIGHIKAAGNYAASLYASSIAAKKGYTQVLWLDAVHRRFVEEVGTSNIFFLIDDELITPPLTGTILPGITRDSVITLAKHWQIKVVERPMAMDEVVASYKSGRLREVFASGTAAVISPVGVLYYRGEEMVINEGKTGPLTQKLYDELMGIQYGEKEDPFGWRVRVDNERL